MTVLFRPALLGILLSTVFITGAFAHGGGCRKADLPRCCHMDNRTGNVHCH